MRQIFPFLSIVLVALVGIFMVLPHDACISKLVAASNCECAPQASDDGACCCCGPVKAVPMCGTSDDATSHGNEGQPAQKSSTSSCFSISSDLTQMTGPDRAPVATPYYAVVAVLPLAFDLPVASDQPIAAADDAPVPGRRIRVYQDNCVYLI